MDKIKVLYIDDEMSNLKAFKASFRRIFEIFIANSADEGIEILKRIPIEVVIADQRMPGKTGVDFFESILEINPNPIRILLTGYSDINAVIDAINKGHVYRYVAKPWNDFELKLTIEDAYQLYHLKEQNNKLNLKYKRVFTEATDPIILFDTKGRVIDYNKATLDLVNDGKKGALNFSTFNSILNKKAVVQHVIKVLDEEGMLKDYECQIISNSGKKKDCLISGNIITNNYGEIISYQAIIKDVTKKIKLSQLLLEKMIETQEQERERISRDLHDGIGQNLAAIKLHLHSLSAKYDNKKDITSELKKVPEIVQDAIIDLRRICFNTLPIVLQEYGLLKAIKELQLSVSNMDFEIKFKHENNFPHLSKTLEISIFRIIQEFINNSIKHSDGTMVKIDLTNNNGNIILNLKDNGNGFDIKNMEAFKGYGLKNVQNRVESFKGELKINSTKDKGTEYDVVFPISLN
jgi:PAS domain S-box-containing protein